MSASERTPLLVAPAEQNADATPASPTEESSFSFKTISRRKKFILISMSFVNFCAAACFSLPAPFFPNEANIKGASSTVVGFIFGMFEFVIFISSPIFGNFLSKIGCKFMFISGVMVCGSCAILFGTLVKSPDGLIFIVMCFLCRGMEALGCSAYITALFAILAHEFPDNVITVMGSLETFSGLGMMVGPPIGGALYELGGFGVPFYLLGSVVIVVGCIAAYLMPSIPEGKKMYKGSVLHLLKSPLVLVTFINIAAGSISLGFMDPTLSNHLLSNFGFLVKSPLVWVMFINIAAGSISLGFMDPTLSNHLLSNFHLKTWLIGVMFLIAPGIYAITAPIWGYLGDKKGKIRLMIFAGSSGAIISMLLLGPSPLLGFIPTELYINVIALALVGLTVGCGLIPTFKALLVGANSLGMPNDLDTYGKVSGFFNSSFSLGAFLGPTIGGSLVDKFGFAWACTAVAGFFAVAVSDMHSLAPTLVDKFGFAWACTAVAGFFAVAAILMLSHILLVPTLPTLPDEPPAKDVEVAVSNDDRKKFDVEATGINSEPGPGQGLSSSESQHSSVSVNRSTEQQTPRV